MSDTLSQGQDAASALSPNGHRPLMCRGIRGATTVSDNSKEQILEATRELLQQIVTLNGVEIDDVASVFFTTTTDLTAEYPALAARQLGWLDTALMCGHEMSVQGSLPRCLRVLIHWNTVRRPSEVIHVYIRGAEMLRPDKSIQHLASIEAFTQTNAQA